MAEQPSVPPNKKIRLEVADPDPAPAEESSEKAEEPLLTRLADDIVIFLCTFLSYQRGVIALDRSCQQIHKIIKKNQTSCIRHFEFGTREFSYSSNCLFMHIKNVLKQGFNVESHDSTPNRWIIECVTWFRQTHGHLFDKFANLQSLQLLTLDQTVMNLEDAKAINIYIKCLLKPLAPRLTALTVDTWEDGAIFAVSFNFENMSFPNVRSLTINGKDGKIVHLLDLLRVNVLMVSQVPFPCSVQDAPRSQARYQGLQHAGILGRENVPRCSAFSSTVG